MRKSRLANLLRGYWHALRPPVRPLQGPPLKNSPENSSQALNHAEYLVNIVLDLLNKKAIHIFGDSHSLAFSGLSNVFINHIGPVTAFNLNKENTTTKGKEKLFQLLAKLNPTEDAIGLSFGEIDCRVHVIRQAIIQKRSIRSIVEDVASNYIDVINQLAEYGFRLIVLGMSGAGGVMNPSYPKIGRERERNIAMITLNSILRDFSSIYKFTFVEMSDIVVDYVKLSSRHEFLSDGCHLNKFPNTSKDLQCILLSRLVGILVHAEDCCLRVDPIFKRVNHADGAQFTLTSSYGSFPIRGQVRESDSFFFHTDIGEREGIVIELEVGCIIDEIIIHNRKDCCFDMARELVAEIYRVGPALDVIEAEFPVTDSFLAGNEHISRISFEPITCCRIKIFSKALTCLHFSFIEVNGDYPDIY